MVTRPRYPPNRDGRHAVSEFGTALLPSHPSPCAQRSHGSVRTFDPADVPCERYVRRCLRGDWTRQILFAPGSSCRSRRDAIRHIVVLRQAIEARGLIDGASERHRIKLLLKHLHDAPNTLDKQAASRGPAKLGIRKLRLPLFPDSIMRLKRSQLYASKRQIWERLKSAYQGLSGLASRSIERA